MGSSKNKSSSSSSHHHRSSNGNLQEIFNSCVNCEIPLDNGTTKVAEFMLSFSESNKRTFSVLEALSSIFELSTTEFEKRKLPALTTKNLVMCPQCATVLANLYKNYVELMQLSKSSANICKLISKAQMWHQKKQEFLSNSPDTSEEEDDEDSESEEEAPLPTPKGRGSGYAAKGKGGRPPIKREPIDDDEEDEEEEENNDDDDDEEYEVAGKRRKSGLTLKKSKASKRGRKAKKVEHSDNGEFEDYDPDDEDFTPKRKTPGGRGAASAAAASGDRGRSRQRSSTSALSLDGTPRKRIRRRPSQTREDDYKCTECDRIFKFECRLIKHMKTHQDEKKLYCSQCDKSYIYSWMLENHVLSVHEKVEPDECDACGLLFFRKDIFDNHFCTPKNKQEEERREKPHWCQLCGKSFNKLAHLTLHLRSHEDEKPLNCPSCSLKFKYEKCLQKHLQVHESEFQCPICKKSFQQKTRMKVHLATHSAKDKSRSRASTTPTSASGGSRAEKESKDKDAGPFHCSSCTLTFFRKADLNRHTKSKNCKGNLGAGAATPVSSGTLKQSIKIKQEPLNDIDTEPIDSPEEGDYPDEEDSNVSSDEEEATAATAAATKSTGATSASVDISDVDSMSPAVSNSDNEEQASLPSSPPRSPKLNLSEDDESEAGDAPAAADPEIAPVDGGIGSPKPLGIGKIDHQRNEPDLSDASN